MSISTEASNWMQVRIYNAQAPMCQSNFHDVILSFSSFKILRSVQCIYYAMRSWRFILIGLSGLVRHVLCTQGDLCYVLGAKSIQIPSK